MLVSPSLTIGTIAPCWAHHSCHKALEHRSFKTPSGSYQLATTDARCAARHTRRLFQDPQRVVLACYHRGPRQRAMFERNHAKDQTMTVLKRALANLVMWARDAYFPATYAQASLSPPCTVLPLAEADRAGQRHPTGGAASGECRRLRDDLAVLCLLVEAARPRLPDGRRLVLRIAGVCCLTVSADPGRAA